MLSRLRAKVPKKASDPFSYAIFGTFALSRDNTSSDSDSDLSDGDFVITTDDGESSNTTDNIELKDAKDPMCYAPDH